MWHMNMLDMCLMCVVCRECWQQLLELMENREQRLQAAGEIHRFHRDVAEALSRIQEKDAALPDDLGRDLNSVLALIRRHEGFENDLVALEAQLQVGWLTLQCNLL
jgi:spectrin beta